jgi:hypothetical protein
MTTTYSRRVRAQRRLRGRIEKAVERIRALYAQPKWNVTEWNAELCRAEQQLCSALRRYVEKYGGGQYYAWELQHVVWRLSPDYVLFINQFGDLELTKRVVVGIIRMPTT